MKESHRLVAILFAIMMVFMYMPARAFANTETGEPAAGTMKTITVPAEVSAAAAEVDLADNDELLMGYIEKSLKSKPKSGMLKALRNSRGENLKGNDKIVYDLLKVELAKIASGEKTDATIQISLKDINPDVYQESYTAEDLGVAAIVADDEITDDAFEAMYRLYSYDFSAVYNALLADMPYELYWFDKTVPCVHVGPPIAYDGRTASFAEPYFTFYFSGAVAEEYRDKNIGSITTDDGSVIQLYTVITDDISGAIANAQTIIDSHADESDLDKLIGYRKDICNMTDYNQAAIDDDSTPYGNPWQMLWVFDGKEDTKVVCEGYSKAFQFLCDNTEFDNDLIECHTVSGVMNGGTGAGDHMWNVLSMDNGRNYIADITNCDEGSIGDPDKLFLKGYSEGNIDGYYYNVEDVSVYYSYDKSTRNQFSAAELTMSETDYIEGQSIARPVSATWNYKGDQKYVRGVIGTKYIYSNDFYYGGNELIISFEDGSIQTYICRDIDLGDKGIYTGYFLNGDTSGGEGSDFNRMYMVVNSGGEPDDKAVFSEGDNLFYIIANVYGYKLIAGPYSAAGYAAGGEPVEEIDPISPATSDDKGTDDAAEKANADKAAAAEKAAAEAAAAAEAKAKAVKTVTVNTATVTAKTIDKAVKAKGGSEKYVTKIVLGSKVKKISKNAFKKYTKVKSLEVKTKKLKKAAIKGSLKGSKVTTIKVKVGKSADNKKYVKAYKKIFTKANTGKKVSVK